MKNWLTIIVFILLLQHKADGQETVKKQLLEIFTGLDAARADSLVQVALNAIFSRPDLFNDLYAKKLESISTRRPGTYKFLRDLNIKFKTFQTDSLPVSLGLEYKYENSWVKNSMNVNSNFFQQYNLSFQGNVAFRKKLNPNNFLESQFSYDGAFMLGGKAKEIDDATSELIQLLEDSILTLRSRKEPYLHLYQQVNNFISVSDQFYIGLKGKLAYESNQDFSKRQLVPGFLLGIGAKAWNDKEALRYFNLPDYPFALIRLLTGTDKKFDLYGATFPSFLFGLDRVIPGEDLQRESFAGNLSAFNRLRFEAGFKTRVARIANDLVHFSATFRWYKEMNAPLAIKNNKLDEFIFFAASLEAGNGFFVSYTTGKLPFDLRSNQVYALGFKYNFGNWQN